MRAGAPRAVGAPRISRDDSPSVIQCEAGESRDFCATIFLPVAFGSTVCSLFVIREGPAVPEMLTNTKCLRDKHATTFAPRKVEPKSRRILC